MGTTDTTKDTVGINYFSGSEVKNVGVPDNNRYYQKTFGSVIQIIRNK